MLMIVNVRADSFVAFREPFDRFNGSRTLHPKWVLDGPIWSPAKCTSCRIARFFAHYCNGRLMAIGQVQFFIGKPTKDHCLTSYFRWFRGQHNLAIFCSWVKRGLGQVLFRVYPCFARILWTVFRDTTNASSWTILESCSSDARRFLFTIRSAHSSLRKHRFGRAGLPRSSTWPSLR